MTFTMAEEFCSYHLNELGQLVQFHRTTMFALCVLHFMFSPVAALGNILVIRALWKASSMPANIKKFFLSLVVSDLAVGLFAQLMLAVVLRMATNEGHNFDLLCPTILTVCYFSFILLAYASFLNVTAIAVDRLLAITLHLRYQELVTLERVIIALVSIWITSGVTASLFVSLNIHNIMVGVIVEFIGILFTTVAYIHIYRVVRHHQNQIHSQLQQQNAQAMERFREKKSAFNTVHFYVIFVACYLPNFCSTLLLTIDNSQISFWLANYVTFFFVLLNSSLNPVVYCWRYREIRQIMKSTVKKIFRFT